MKHTRNRLLALALALTMTLSTLATGALPSSRPTRPPAPP